MSNNDFFFRYRHCSEHDARLQDDGNAGVRCTFGTVRYVLGSSAKVQTDGGRDEGSTETRRRAQGFSARGAVALEKRSNETHEKFRYEISHFRSECKIIKNSIFFQLLQGADEATI